MTDCGETPQVIHKVMRDPVGENSGRRPPAEDLQREVAVGQPPEKKAQNTSIQLYVRDSSRFQDPLNKPMIPC